MKPLLYLNKTKITYILKITALLLISVITNPLRAQQQEQVDFYLPTFTKQNGALINQLSSALSDAGLGNINVKSMDHWQQYQQSVRHGRRGFYLSPPHFSSWLQHEHDFNPIAKLKGTLSYLIISNTNDTDIFETRDLIKKKICTQHPLNLDYLLISQAFAKNVQSAETHIVDSVSNELRNPHSPCAAFSISEHSFNQSERKNPGKYIRLMQGPRFSNYAILADSTIHRDKIVQFKFFLKQQNVQTILKPLLDHISPDATFIETQDNDYPKQDSQALANYWLQ